MAAAAPRIDARLHAALARIDDGSIPIAEINRRVGLVADELGLTRPSYEQVRRLVHERRRLGAYPSTGEVLLEIAANSRPPTAVMDHLLGTAAPKRGAR